MGDLLQINQHIEVTCHRHGCGRVRRFSAVEAIETFGFHATLDQAKARAKCAGCGERGRDGFISVRPCSLDWEASRLRGKHQGERLAEALADIQRLLGDREMGGDGPVQWPVEGPLKGQ